MKIIIAHSSAQDKWKQPICDLDAYRWIYFGRDVQRFFAIKQTLGETTMLNAGVLINQIATEIRDEFINFDQHLAVDNTDLLWQATDLAERSPYTSDFFFRCCAYLAFHRILQSFDNNLLVLTEDWFLSRLMAQRARSRGFEVLQFTNSPISDHFPDLTKYTSYRLSQADHAIKSRVMFVGEFLRRKRIIASYPRTNTFTESGASKSVDTLLVTWVDPETFRADGLIERDTFYGELPKYLRAHGRRIGYLANPAAWVFPFEQIIQSIQSAQDWMVVPEECLGLLDVLGIVVRTLFCSWKLKSRFIIQSVDLTELLKDELVREKAKDRQCWAMQFYCIGRFLLKRNIRPPIVIHLFENQPWEKALRLGFRRYLPEVTIVGYQHAPFAPLLLSQYPSRQDLQQHQIPDRIVTLGPKWKTLLSEHGYPEEALGIGAALRFSHLKPQRQKDLDQPRTGTNTVLVAAPIGYADSFELIHKTLDALRATPEIKVLIKFHPKTGDNFLLDRLLQSVLGSLGLKDLPDHFEITERPISELLQSVAAVLHNGTSVAIEALAEGASVICVQSDLWFDMDTLAFFQGASVVARTPAEILRCVRDLLDQDDMAARTHSEDTRDTLEQVFSPIHEETMNVFLRAMPGVKA